MNGQEEVLRFEDVLMGQASASMEDAIALVGSRLVDRGVAADGYVDDMLQRERNVPTYLGNGVAMPHGTLASKESVKGAGLVVAQFPDGVDWGIGTAHLVIGLAASGDDHVHLLSQMAEVLQDEELCERLWVTDDARFLYDTLRGLHLDDDDDEVDVPEMQVVITDPAGLHARPATLIVELAKEHQAEITIARGDKVANAGSIMSMLALGATAGDAVLVSATAADDATAGRVVAAVADILTAEGETDG
ncbi:MAG: HPr family phosphocarrier protein [Actinomycetota bacterium]